MPTRVVQENFVITWLCAAVQQQSKAAGELENTDTVHFAVGQHKAKQLWSTVTLSFCQVWPVSPLYCLLRPKFSADIQIEFSI